MYGKTCIHSIWVIQRFVPRNHPIPLHSFNPHYTYPWTNEKYLKKYPSYSLVLFLELWTPSVERFEKQHLFPKEGINIRNRKKNAKKKKWIFCFYKKRSFKNKFKEKKEVLRSCDLKCSDSKLLRDFFAILGLLLTIPTALFQLVTNWIGI